MPMTASTYSAFAQWRLDATWIDGATEREDAPHHVMQR